MAIRPTCRRLDFRGTRSRHPHLVLAREERLRGRQIELDEGVEELDGEVEVFLRDREHAGWHS